MIKVTVTRTVRKPEFQIFTNTVCLCLHGFDRLTPRAARAALEIAFGQTYGGHVSFGDVTYALYPKSARRKKQDPIWLPDESGQIQVKRAPGVR